MGVEASAAPRRIRERLGTNAIPLAIGKADGVLSELRHLGRTEWDRSVIVHGFWV